MATAVHRIAAALSAATVAALLSATTVATAPTSTSERAGAGDESSPTDIVLTVGLDETKRNVAWYTEQEESGQDGENVVQWAPASAVEGDAFPEGAALEAEPVSVGETHDGRYFSHATIYGLEPSTDYVYRVGSAGAWSSTFEFSTGAFDADRTEFVVVGDPQLGSSGDVAADQLGWETTLDTATGMFPGTAWVHSLGDQVQKSASEEQYRALLSPDALRSVPFAFTLGNHDFNSTAYATHFFMPEAGDTAGYHWYRHGNVLVIGLDSNSLDAEAHGEYIERVLAEPGADAPWRIAAFHHTPFGHAKYSNTEELVEFRGAIAPVLSDYGIDLALMGHDHAYTRTHLMEGGEPVASDDPAELRPLEDQTLYLTLNSSSGSKYYSFESDDGLQATDQPGADYMHVTWQQEVPSFTHVEVEGDAMKIATYRTDTREAYDEVVLHRAGAPEPSASPSSSPSTRPSSHVPSPTPASSPDAAVEEEGGLPAGAIAAIAFAAIALAVGGLAFWNRRRGGQQN